MYIRALRVLAILLMVLNGFARNKAVILSWRAKQGSLSVLTVLVLMLTGFVLTLTVFVLMLTAVFRTPG